MTEEAKVRLARRLREARESAELSQDEVARQLALPRPAISQIENGKRRVEALELARFAKLYGRPLGHFAEEEPVGAARMDALHRAAADLSEEDREQVVQFAEFLRQKATEDRR